MKTKSVDCKLYVELRKIPGKRGMISVSEDVYMIDVWAKTPTGHVSLRTEYPETWAAGQERLRWLKGAIGA